MLEGINVPGYVVFAALGYFCGWCFRTISLIKIILVLLIVPSVFQWVMMIDEMLWVTLPFLVGIALGLRGFGPNRGGAFTLDRLTGNLTNRLGGMFRWRR